MGTFSLFPPKNIYKSGDTTGTIKAIENLPAE
jgi:hypothetical protein